MYTGQAGAWNALFVGDNNAANNSASKTALTNGGGNTTTVAFKMGTATSAGASGGNWKAGYVETSGGNLREEQAYVYYPQVTANHFNWELTGLSPNAHYRLTLFGNGGDSYTNIANTVAGVLDAEGDWNWADIQADASGVIAGNFLNTASNNDVRLLYGLQAEGTMPLVSTGSAYDTWATTNAGGQTAEKDYNNDGVSNGVAYFMGENGITTNPGVVDGKVAWPYVNSVASYKVQISYDLSPSGWVDVAANDAKLHDTGLGGSVTYDLLPAEQGQLFARLVVTP
jgi:hypothetical protein